MERKMSVQGSGKRAKMSDLPVRWRYVLVMVCVLGMSIGAMLIYYRSSLQILTDERLSQTQIMLNRDSAKLDEELYMTFAIPDAISSSQYYGYIRHIHSGELPQQYYSLMPLIMRNLQTLIYLRAPAEQTLLYLQGTDSVVATGSISPRAEDCFRDSFLFSRTSPEELLEMLRSRNSISLLSMQDVTVNGQTTPCMALIISTNAFPISVMSLYSEGTILESLGFRDLPEDTYLRILASDGQVLFQYPGEITEDVERESRLLISSMEKMNVQVEVRIPDSYFAEQLSEAKLIGAALIVAVGIIGAVLIALLSRLSVRPIHRLISKLDNGQVPAGTSELAYLDKMFSASRERNRRLRSALTGSLLARVFSGSILSAEEEEFLEQSLEEDRPSQDRELCAAMIHAEPDINSLFGEQMLEGTPGLFWTIVGPTETGVLLWADRLEALSKAVESFNRRSDRDKRGVSCGISGAVKDLSLIYSAVRQARLAIPDKCGVGRFSGEVDRKHTSLRLQYERLYQRVFTLDTEDAIRQLDEIAGLVDYSNVHDVFYNVRFTLLNAAEELGLDLAELDQVSFDAHELPRENIRRLEVLLRQLASLTEEKRREQRDHQGSALLAYIQEHLADTNLCAASVAEAFGTSEKRVYALVRQETDMSFNTYLTSLRMKRAGQLLFATQESVADIARRCGYQAESTFYRVFKRYYQIPPNQYRNEGREPES